MDESATRAMSLAVRRRSGAIQPDVVADAAFGNLWGRPVADRRSEPCRRPDNIPNTSPKIDYEFPSIRVSQRDKRLRCLGNR